MKAPRVQLSSDFASSTIKYFASVNWHIFKSFYDDLCCLSTACFRCQNSKTLKRRATRNFSWAGEISWNRGTSIKASCTTQKKRPRREKIDVFCPRYSTNCILNENLTHRCMQTGHSFFQNQGTFLENRALFSISKTDQGRPAPD